MLSRRIVRLTPLCRGMSHSGPSPSPETNLNSHANLGEITQYLLHEGVPGLLQRNYSSTRIHPDAQLRLFPMRPYTPTVRGRRKLEASLNALRFLLTTFVLPRGSDNHIHIHAAHSLAPGVHSPHAVCPEASKLLVRWATCTPEEHGRHQQESRPRHRWSVRGGRDSASAEPPRGIVDFVLRPSEENRGVSERAAREWQQRLLSQSGTLSGSGSGPAIPLPPAEITRVLQGIFMFEFSADNSQILVHTIDDVEMIDYERKKVRSAPKMFAC